MIIRNFTSEDYPAIVNIHSSLNIVWPEMPRTPEGWAAIDQNRSPKNKHKRWVAVEDGHVDGFASYSQSPWSYPPDSFHVNVEVHPDHQRRGIGSALYDQVMDDVQASIRLRYAPIRSPTCLKDLPSCKNAVSTKPSAKHLFTWM